MKKTTALVFAVVVILLSCTTVKTQTAKTPTESSEERWARIDAERKQKKEAFVQPLSDPRFNGTFYAESSNTYGYKWTFNGTNSAFYYNGWYSYVESSWYHYEIRIEDGVLYHASWPLMGYREESDRVYWTEDGKYSFTDDGALVLTKETRMRDGRPFTYTLVFLRDKSKDKDQESIDYRVL